MFQNLWASNVSVFGYMTNQDYGNVGFFGKFYQFGSSFSNLRNTSRSRFDIISMKRLNGIDDDDFGFDSFNLFEDILGFSLIMLFILP